MVSFRIIKLIQTLTDTIHDFVCLQDHSGPQSVPIAMVVRGNWTWQYLYGACWDLQGVGIRYLVEPCYRRVRMYSFKTIHHSENSDRKNGISACKQRHGSLMTRCLGYHFDVGRCSVSRILSSSEHRALHRTFSPFLGVNRKKSAGGDGELVIQSKRFGRSTFFCKFYFLVPFWPARLRLLF